MILSLTDLTADLPGDDRENPTKVRPLPDEDVEILEIEPAE
jgi:hypothetical protein